MAINEAAKGWLAVIRQLHTFNKTFPKAFLKMMTCLAASILLYNTTLVVHMVGITPETGQGGSLHRRSLPAARSWIMEFGTNMQIWALA